MRAKLLALPVMSHGLYSIRMRAECGGVHCSGAERIAPAGELPALAAELVARALACGLAPDSVRCLPPKKLCDPNAACLSTSPTV